MKSSRRSVLIGTFLVCAATRSMAASPATEPSAPASESPAVPVTASPTEPQEPSHETAAPTTILYQGRLTDAGGVPRTGTVSITFALYADAATPTSLWNETHIAVPLTDGVFSVLLGSLNAFPSNAWSDPERWLGISVDGAAEMSPRLHIASVPFAIEANRLTGKRATDFDAAGAGAIAAAGVQAQLKGSDLSPPNEGSNQVHWNNLYGVPAGFVDGVDDVGAGVTVHGQLQGLDANDHPQYALNSALQSSDGTPPNIGSDRVHWDNLGGVPAELVAKVLPKEWIAPGSLDSTRFAAGGVATANLAPGAVTESRIGPGAVTTVQIQDNSITSTDVQNGSLTGDDIQNGSVSGADILDESIFTTDIANGSILGVDLAPGAIGGTQVADNAIPGAKLQDNTVPGSKLVDDSITGARLVTGAVGARELGPNAVSGNNVVDGSVPVAKLSDPPGLSSVNVPGYVDSVTSTTGQTVGSITLNVPGPGHVLVTGAGQVYALHNLGTGTTVSLGVSQVPNDLEDSEAATLVLPGGFPSDLYIYPIESTSVFPVAGPGPVTFYVTAKKGTQPRDPSIHDLRIHALYVKSEY